MFLYPIPVCLILSRMDFLQFCKILIRKELTQVTLDDIYLLAVDWTHSLQWFLLQLQTEKSVSHQGLCWLNAFFPACLNF